MLDLGTFVQGDRIGKGSFATVYKGHHKHTRAAVAIKTVHRAHLNKDKRLLDNFEAEMAILKSLKHPHVVSLIEVVQTESDFHLVMEYCSLGDLSYFIRKRAQLVQTLPLVAAMFEQYPSPAWGGLNDTVTRHFLTQLSSALAFLRAQNLVHRDIKPQNLLLRPPVKSQAAADTAGYVGLWELPVLKLADFGFARFLPSTSMAETLCGSPLYMAPEILHYEKYNAKADLWSVGAVAYEMAVGKPPFPAANHMDLIKRIDAAKDNIRFPVGSDVGAEVKAVVRGLLKRSPAERMSFEEFFTHPALSVAAHGALRSQEVDESMFVSEYLAPKQPEVVAAGIPLAVEKATARHEAAATAAAAAAAAAGISPRGGPRPNPTRASPARVSPVPTESSSGKSSGLSGSRRSPHSPPPSVSPPSLRGSRAHTPPSPRRPFAGVSGSAVSSGSDSAGSSGGGSGRGSGGGRDGSYVLVEKRTVEVNSLADDLAKPPPPPRRRTSVVYGTSPTNALAQALIKSSARLFGARIDSSTASVLDVPAMLRNRSPSAGASPSSAVAASPASAGVLTAGSSAGAAVSAEEKELLSVLEDLATMGKVVGLFADIKYARADRGDRELAASRTSPGLGVSPPVDPTVQDVLAQEALALYLKVLSLYAQAMDRAQKWWDATDAGEASPGVNTLVQYIRDKFNDTVDRAEATRALILNASTAFEPGSHVSAEKMLFERALEMARAAAVQELGPADLTACEMNYGTAVWMLRALLETDHLDEMLNGDDRAMVDKLMDKIGVRLGSLRRRIEGRAPTPL